MSRSNDGHRDNVAAISEYPVRHILNQYYCRGVVEDGVSRYHILGFKPVRFPSVMHGHTVIG